MSNFIRNKPELIRRAQAHREADRLGQGFFAILARHVDRDGRATLKSKNSVSLCALGCLATPPRKPSYLIEKFGSRSSYYGGNFGVMGTNVYQVLQQEFGIPEALATLVDNIFEELTPREAKLWPEQFARALPRRSITDADVDAFTDSKAYNAAQRCWGRPRLSARRQRDALLRWLRTGK